MKRANGIAEFSLVGSVMTWTYGDNIAPTVYDLATNPQYETMTDFTSAAYRNGIKQKIGDAGAISNATVAEKAQSQRDVAAQLTAMEWSGDRSSLLADAVQRVTGANPATVAATLKGLDKKQRRELENDVEVIAMIATIQTERAKRAGLDGGKILAAMFGKKK